MGLPQRSAAELPAIYGGLIAPISKGQNLTQQPPPLWPQRSWIKPRLLSSQGLLALPPVPSETAALMAIILQL